jgi:hypothetical protein
MKTRITERALACLNATNEAIVRSDYRDEVLQGVTCCAQDGGFIGAAVLLADPDQSLISTAGTGHGIEVMKGVKISRSKTRRTDEVWRAWRSGRVARASAMIISTTGECVRGAADG